MTQPDRVLPTDPIGPCAPDQAHSVGAQSERLTWRLVSNPPGEPWRATRQRSPHPERSTGSKSLGVRLAGGSKSLCPQWRGSKQPRAVSRRSLQGSAGPALPNRPGRAVHAGNPPPETRRAVRWPLGTRESRTETERPCAPQIRPRKRRADQEPGQGYSVMSVPTRRAHPRQNRCTAGLYRKLRWPAGQG